MAEHTDILLWVAGWAWVSLVTFIVWLFKRQNRIEAGIQERRGIVNTAVAVLEASQESLRSEFEKDAKRNTEEHQNIIARIDTLDVRVMNRLDSLLKLARNGSGN